MALPTEYFQLSRRFLASVLPELTADEIHTLNQSPYSAMSFYLPGTQDELSATELPVARWGRSCYLVSRRLISIDASQKEITVKFNSDGFKHPAGNQAVANVVILRTDRDSSGTVRIKVRDSSQATRTFGIKPRGYLTLQSNAAGAVKMKTGYTTGVVEL